LTRKDLIESRGAWKADRLSSEVAKGEDRGKKDKSHGEEKGTRHGDIEKAELGRKHFDP